MMIDRGVDLALLPVALPPIISAASFSSAPRFPTVGQFGENTGVDIVATKFRLVLASN
jgi:hypothetical protein